MQKENPVLGPIKIDESDGSITAPHPFDAKKSIIVGVMKSDSMGVSHRKYFCIAQNSFEPLLASLGKLASLADSRVNGDDREPNSTWERTLYETQELIRSIHGGIDLAKHK